MTRPLRIESEEGVYHVINRGNYRGPIFRLAKTKTAFLETLDETCARTAWVVHSWTVMSNHFHLALSTPQANLSDGMKWLAGTFARRFNEYRRERGHLFQGRFKGLVVEPGEGLGALCHYIHLNPVRARLCRSEDLPAYAWSSAGWLTRDQSVLPGWYDPRPALQHAGNLAWTPEGVHRYFAYLTWLAEDEPAKKRLRFDQMSKGWLIGSPGFARAMAEERRELLARGPQLASTTQPMRESFWQECLQAELAALGRSEEELHLTSRSEPWKLALAVRLRARSTVTNRWLGQHLHLGARDEVSRKLTAWQRRNPPT